MAVFRDVTDRARAGAELAAAKAALETELDPRAQIEADLAAQKDVAVLTCDSQGHIVHANRAARTALPSAGEPPGTTTIHEASAVMDMRHPDGTPLAPTETPLVRAMEGDEITGAEAVITLPSGERRTIFIHARPLRDPTGPFTGRITGAVASAYDITALREREAELAGFAGVAAHDLRSPLTTVRGFTELVRNALADADPSGVREADAAGGA